MFHAHPGWLMLAAALWLSWPTIQARADEGPARAGEAAQPARAEERIQQALGRRLDWDFSKTPLLQVADQLQQRTGVEILLDNRQLHTRGLSPQVPVSLQARNLSLRAGLNHLLRPMDLVWMVHNEALWITTQEFLEMNLETHVHPVADLAYSGLVHEGKPVYDYDTLIDLLTTLIEPESWPEISSPASVPAMQGALVISQTQPLQWKISRFLATYRQLGVDYQNSPEQVRVPWRLADSEDSEAIRRALTKNISLNTELTPLAEVAHWLAQQLTIPVLVDWQALEDLGIGPDVPVTARVAELPLETALGRILEPLDLDWHILDEALVITGRESCGGVLQTRFFPIYDLLEVTRLTPGYDDFARPNREIGDFIQMITMTLEPASWMEVGGLAAIEAVANPPALIISQTPQVHRQVTDLLADLRRARAQERRFQEQLEANNAQELAPQLRLWAYHLPAPEADPPQPSAAEVGRLIRRLVAPTSWEQEDVVLETINGVLVIRQTDQVHREVQQLLRLLTVGGMPAPGRAY